MPHGNSKTSFFPVWRCKDSVIWFAWNTGCPLLHRSRIGSARKELFIPSYCVLHEPLHPFPKIPDNIALKKLLNQNQLKEEQEKIEKYDSNSMFKDKKNKTENMQLKQVSVTKYEESFFSKIFNKIKKIFNK